MPIRALTKADTFAYIFTLLIVMPSLPEAAKLGRPLMALVVLAAVIDLKISLAAEKQREHSYLYGEDADWNLHVKLLIIAIK